MRLRWIVEGAVIFGVLATVIYALGVEIPLKVIGVLMIVGAGMIVAFIPDINDERGD